MNSAIGKKIANNTILNFIGQIIPIIVLIIVMPFIIKGFGIVRFGFFYIIWIIIGNFAVFNLGLGKAVNKFVSEAIGKENKKEIPQIIWTAIMIQFVFGIIGGIVFALITPLLVGHLFKVPQNLAKEALISLYFIAPSIPIILITASLIGVLSAYQRFDIINAVKIPANSLTYILILICVLLKFNLPQIVLVMLFIRFISLVIFALFVFRLIPELKRLSISFGTIPRFFFYGGWVMISNVTGTIIVYLDRFLVGIILSMSAVAYYSVPYEAVTRLWIIPSSLTMALFPSFSNLDGYGDKKKISEIFFKSIKYIFLIFGPVVIFVILFAKNILKIWVGSSFALKSTLPMQILVLGVFINSIGHIYHTLIQAVGHPDVTAKLYIIELPIFIATGWLFINYLGISGAAVAWTLRVLVDTVLLSWASFKIYGLSAGSLKNNRAVKVFFAFVVLTTVVFIIKFLLTNFSLQIQLFAVLILFLFFALFSWKIFFDEYEKDILMKVFKLRKN
jgi:O-antigen/teichoic acid export membrane protein